VAAKKYSKNVKSLAISIPSAMLGIGINAHIKNAIIIYLSLKAYLLRTIKDNKIIDGKK
tara:strand:- start:848 stop:1024 length:177 start_codon:yes stop_codon:yes gene_type:complete